MGCVVLAGPGFGGDRWTEAQRANGRFGEGDPYKPAHSSLSPSAKAAACGFHRIDRRGALKFAGAAESGSKCGEGSICEKGAAGEEVSFRGLGLHLVGCR